MNTEKLVRLLIIEESFEDAEQLISILRNGGIAVRPGQASDEEDVLKALDDRVLDMILFSLDSAALSLEDVAEIVGRSNKDIPIVAIMEELDEEKAVGAIQDGAVTFALSSAPEHVQAVVRAELKNLTARRQVRALEISLRESESRCNVLLDSANSAIAYVHEGMHVYANKAYLELFECSELEDLEGMPLLDNISPENHKVLKSVLRDISKGKPPPENLDVLARLPSGEVMECSMEFSPASIEGEPCTQIVLSHHDQQPELAKEIDELRTLDLLTGLLNRQYFSERLGRAIKAATEGNTEQHLLHIEIDNFRATVELVGIGGTDLILSDLAGLLRERLSETDQACRLGDQAFGVLTKGNIEHAESLAHDICSDFEEHISEVGKQSVSLTCSIGVVAIGEGLGNVQDLLTTADSTSREAADKGGNQFNYFNPTTSKAHKQDEGEHWANLIKDALANNKFRLIFQPIVSLHGAEGEYYEVLLRMQGADDEIQPAYFLPAAESHNLLPEIDRWVIERTIEKLAEREKSGRKTTFFINITTQSMADATMLPWLAKQLQSHRMRGDALVFELPESKVVTNMKPARKFRRGLKQLHCGFALEQFGSGLNSFQVLKHLSADYLKIDRIFMLDLPNNPENQQKIREITDQAHAAGKLTVAEFVEDAASMSVLWQCGVNFVQGNFLQEPEKVLSYDFG